jgi:hypothetical protein
MGLQAWIVDRPALGEVVEHLETVSSESEGPVCEVVEEATDPGAADAACFGLEVEDLSDDACLPKEPLLCSEERDEPRQVLRLFREAGGRLGHLVDGRQVVLGDR